MAPTGGGADRRDHLPRPAALVRAQPPAPRNPGETEYRRRALEIARNLIPEQRLSPGDLRADALPELRALAAAELRRTGVDQPALNLACVKEVRAVAEGHPENRAAAVGRAHYVDDLEPAGRRSRRRTGRRLP